MGRDLPAGTVTFLFTDVEGSTKLLHALGAEGYAGALLEHRRVLREAFTRHGGVEVDTQGDAFFVAFPTAPGALAAATEATAALADGPIRVRMGLHTGTPHLTAEGYVGPDVHRAARIAAAGHGGQILVSSATAQLVGETLRDLGDHRLKDLTAPERIYQADPDEHPPLKTLHQTNLPVPATPFLGREADLGELSALLTRDDVRLVTLTGPGGTGKTRLALQAAANAADAFPGGVWWVPLAALRDPALVLESAAKALGAGGGLAEHIGQTKLLLLFDNFEHLTSAAADLAPLLAACPSLAVLVTSREPLHLAGEYEYAVDPLTPTEAVELFMTRAVAARRDFAANGEVAAICERLDNLPLAIELAAARAKVLTPKALLERLEQRLPLLTSASRDAPDRQRTLRATIEWSHELLTSDEQRLFRRLAVFRGGCTLEAAEAVAEVDLDTLQSLVDKSLVRVRDTGRFWMLETIREFAVEQLDASGEADAIRARHAAFFLALAEEAEPHLHAGAAEWMARIADDHDNVRATFAHLDATHDTQALMRLAGALWRFFVIRGHISEGHRLMERALELDHDATRARVSALCGATIFALDVRDRPLARTHVSEALATAREIGDRFGEAVATQLTGSTHADVDEWETALGYYQQALGQFEAVGSAHYTLLTKRLIAWMHYELGDKPRATELHQQVVQAARAIGNTRMEESSLGALGEYAIEDGRIGDALPYLLRSAELATKIGETGELMVGMTRLAWALAKSGRSYEAAQLFAAAEAHRESMGAEPYPWLRGITDEILSLLDGSLDAAARTTASEVGRTLTAEAAIGLASRALRDEASSALR